MQGVARFAEFRLKEAVQADLVSPSGKMKRTSQHIISLDFDILCSDCDAVLGEATVNNSNQDAELYYIGLIPGYYPNYAGIYVRPRKPRRPPSLLRKHAQLSGLETGPFRPTTGGGPMDRYSERMTKDGETPVIACFRKECRCLNIVDKSSVVAAFVRTVSVHGR